MWRKVKVDDLCRRAIAGNLDAINLKGAIGKVIEVKVGEGDVIGNEEGYSSTRSVLTILPESYSQGGVWDWICWRVWFLGGRR